jgi:cardiolipin synthase
MRRARSSVCASWRPGRLSRHLGAWLLLGSLVGCVALPAFRPDAPAPVAAPRLLGADGLLPPGATRAALARLHGAGAPAALGGHLAYSQAVSGAPVFTGNRARPLVDGPPALTEMLRAIAAARDHVNLEIFVFADDAVGRRVAEALLRKQAEGVQVNLLYDSLGSQKTPRAFFDGLAAAGIAVLEYNPTARGLVAYARRDHRKILVVDGQVAFTGGINISARYAVSSGAFRRRHASPSAAAGLRDTSVEIRGPAVAAFQHLFLETWRREGGPPLAPRNYFPALTAQDGALVQLIGSGPGPTRGAMYLTLLSALAMAEKTAYLTTGFFVPDPQLAQALAGAARRGVDVQLLVPGFSDHPVVQAAGRAHYAALLQDGVRIYEEHGVLLHAKTAVIDGIWSSVGSTNLDPWSFVRNLEADAVILDPGFGGRMRDLFEDDRSRATAITREAWAGRSLGARLLEAYASLWSGLF